MPVNNETKVEPEGGEEEDSSTTTTPAPEEQEETTTSASNEGIDFIFEILVFISY